MQGSDFKRDTPLGVRPCGFAALAHIPTPIKSDELSNLIHITNGLR
jgi:hypothetical protein